MDSVLNQLSKELNLPKEVIFKVYKLYWQTIRDHIQNLPLKSDLTEEEFEQLRTNFNLPSLGKLVCTYDRYKNVKSTQNYLKYDENKEN